MTQDEFMEVHAKAWYEFQGARSALKKKFEARVNVLRKKRQKIVDAALAELNATESTIPALSDEAFNGAT